MRSWLLVAAAALTLSNAGCGSWDPWSGTEGTPAHATILQDVLLVDASLGGMMGPPVVADSGSPVVALSPEGYGVDAGVSTESGLLVGGLTFDGLEVIGADLLQSPDPASPIGGILGCTVLCDFATTFNYRDAELVLGGSATPAGVEAAVTAPFQLQGGGMGLLPGISGIVTLPPSRVALTVTIEGAQHAMIVDTGASITYLRQGIYDALAADQRGQLKGTAETIQGASELSTMRLRSVIVAGAEIKGAPASKDPAIEGLLDSIEAETGHAIDGLVGGSFLREFLVTIDYPGRKLVLRKYTTRDHIVDTFVRVGVVLATPDATTGALVGDVVPGTDAAAKGVTLGDEIVAVDGAKVAGLGALASNALLTGAAGGKHAITFGAAAAPALDHQVVEIAIDDLLPLP